MIEKLLSIKDFPLKTGCTVSFTDARDGLVNVLLDFGGGNCFAIIDFKVGGSFGVFAEECERQSQAIYKDPDAFVSSFPPSDTDYAMMYAEKIADAFYDISVAAEKEFVA